MPSPNNPRLTGRAAELARIRGRKGTLLPILEEQMLHDMDGIPDDRRMDLIHASELSHADLCHRAVSHRILTNTKPAEPFSFQRENVFAEGNEIHRKWQHRMRRTGKLWGQWRCRICSATELGLEPSLTGCKYACGHYWKYNEVPLYLEDRMLIGHADGAVILGPGCVAEIKSVGLGTLRFENPRLLAEHTHHRDGRDVYDLDGIVADIRRPFMTHIRQGNMYSWMCSQLGYPFKTIVFLYEYKWNQQVREFTIQPSQSIIDGMLSQADTIAAAVRQEKLAACPFGGCKKCEDIDEGSLPQAVHPDGPGQQHGHRANGRPGHPDHGRVVVPAAPPGSSRHPAGPARPARPRTDGPVPAGEPVAEIPPVTAGGSRDRRVVSRGGGTHSRGTSSGQERREDSNADESGRERRPGVYRGGGPSRRNLRLP